MAGPSAIGTGIGTDIKEMYCNWWDLGTARMRSGEKPQGKVSWQGQDFRGKGNWKGGELNWKSKTKAKRFSGRVKLFGVKRQTSEETSEPLKCLVMEKHVKDRRCAPGKPIRNAWQKCLASKELSEAHFKVIYLFRIDKSQQSFILSFIFGASAICSSSLHHPE